jgi:hypothetical protein
MRPILAAYGARASPNVWRSVRVMRLEQGADTKEKPETLTRAQQARELLAPVVRLH